MLRRLWIDTQTEIRTIIHNIGTIITTTTTAAAAITTITTTTTTTATLRDNLLV